MPNIKIFTQTGDYRDGSDGSWEDETFYKIYSSPTEWTHVSQEEYENLQTYIKSYNDRGYKEEYICMIIEKKVESVLMASMKFYEDKLNKEKEAINKRNLAKVKRKQKSEERRIKREKKKLQELKEKYQ